MQVTTVKDLEATLVEDARGEEARNPSSRIGPLRVRHTPPCASDQKARDFEGFVAGELGVARTVRHRRRALYHDTLPRNAIQRYVGWTSIVMNRAFRDADREVRVTNESTHPPRVAKQRERSRGGRAAR
jgi:hypothetical protein